MEPRHVNAIMEGVQSLDSDDLRGLKEDDLQTSIDSCNHALHLMYYERDRRKNGRE
jgi:hypothetical protein